MKVQTLYAVAGLIWGLVLGPYTGLAAARTLGDVSWLYEFQNGAWVNWAVIPFGAIIGLTVLLSCYGLGAAAGRRYDDTAGRRLRYVKAVPWAFVLAGIAVGAITVRTLGDEQRAIIGYVLEKKAANSRLLALENDLHRITALDLDLTKSAESIRMYLLLQGKREGDYRIEWQVHSKIARQPILDGSQISRLGPEPGSTDIRINRWAIATEYLRSIGVDPEADVSVDEKFTLTVQLLPILSHKELASLPEDKAQRLREGESILLSRVGREFRLRFALRGGHILW